jgi:ATP-dependent protease Clp ATPase subunit
MANIECSFCGTKAPQEKAKSRFIAGPTVFVCRDCVDMMIDVFGEEDPQWGERKIKALKAMRNATYGWRMGKIWTALKASFRGISN